MAILDDLKATSPAFATMSHQEIADYIHETYAPDWRREDVYSRLGYTPPTSPNPLLKALPQGIESGFRQAQIGTNVALNALGLQGDESTAARISELQRRQQEIAPTGATKEGIEAIRKAGESGDWGEALSTIASNPRAVGRLLLESAGSFIPDIAIAAATGGVAGLAAKALATRIGVKALAPEAVGLATKMAATAGTVGALSGKTEYGAEFLESLQDAGVDLTSSAAIRRAFKNEEIMARAREEGLAKGIPVGLFDGISMGLAGRFYGKIAGATVGSKLAGAAAEAGVQAGLGASGEALGQIAQKGHITNVADVLLEGILEVASAGPEAALNLRNNKPFQAQLQALDNTIARDAEGNQLQIPLYRYDTPAGQLSGPLVDKLIEKAAPRNPEVQRIKDSTLDTDTKRRLALEAIYGPNITQAEINADTIESTADGQAQTGEQRRDVAATARTEQAATEELATRLPDQSTEVPTNVTEDRAAAVDAAAQRDAQIYESQRQELDQFEKTIQEMGAEAFDVPGLANDVRYLRDKVRDYEALQRDRAVDERRGTTQEYSTGYEGAIDITVNPPVPQEAVTPPTEDIPQDLWRVTHNFISQLAQEPGKSGTDNVINLGVLQSRASNNLGRPVPLSLLRDVLDRMAERQPNIAPMVRKDDSGRYRRNSNTYNIPGPVGTNTPERPRVRMSAELAAKDNLSPNPSPEPKGVSPLNWYKANFIAGNSPTGKLLNPNILREAGIPDAQIPRIMRAFQEQEIVTRGMVPRRTTTEVRMPNTLSEERIAKLHRDELTGKSYGC